MANLNTLTYTHLLVGLVGSLIKFPFLTLLILHILLEILVRTNTGKNFALQYLPKELTVYLADDRNTLASTIALFVGYLLGGFLKGCFKN